MRHQGLPAAFTLIGSDEEGKQYIQCTRTGDVLVQTGPEDWTHFASSREWRSKTAARLYPELIFLQRSLKRIGTHEEIEDQLGVIREVQALLTGLNANLQSRSQELESELSAATEGPAAERVRS